MVEETRAMNDATAGFLLSLPAAADYDFCVTCGDDADVEWNGDMF